MLPDRTFTRVAAKEATLFFASPVAFLFLGVFAAVTLFVFFWGEAFFARNIADLRPLFDWMPLLLIFLCSTLTMRMWSEERRSGTLEYVLTQPVPLWQFVLGKFLACLGLLVAALAITLPLPITVSLLGQLDWGPVWAAYGASLLLGAVYLSIGLFVSARSDNQIVSLIGALLVGGLLYLIGSPLVTGLFGNGAAEWLRLLGTGSRFEEIGRGVIDLRDLYYYLSLVALFLLLNVYGLERERWAARGDRRRHRGWQLLTGLLIANALGGNLWLGQLDGLRLDLTEGRIYSLSEATRGQLAQLREPLLIRAYFSAKTHPLLAPLVPQLTDLIEEYRVAGQGKVRVEIVDPAEAPALEQEANQKYGIRPVPFQVADRYQASVVNSYFNVLVQYGDAYQTLGFRDLIEVQQRGEMDLDVRLRNPEYDLTRAIRKVVQSYQSGGNLFDTVRGDLQLNGYLSPDAELPEGLRAFRQTLKQTLDQFTRQAGGRLKVSLVDPRAGDGEVARRIEADYGFRPMAESLLSDRSFYFYLTLSQGDQVVQVPLGDLSADSLKRNLEAGIKRFAAGFTKTLALVTPPGNPQMARYGMGGPQFHQLQQYLGSEFNVRSDDLADGRVAGDVDILLLADPQGLNQKQLFAVDQFLMRGGTVIAATAPFSADLSNRSLALKQQQSGLEAWLQHQGLKLDEQLVLDPQNSAFPIPVTREMGGFQFRELRMMDYPYFVQARGDGLNGDHPVTAGLRSLTLNWASPIEVDPKANAQRRVTELVHSSAGAWLSDSLEVMPRVTRAGVSAFTPEGERGRQLLAVTVQGRFDSFFAGQPSPLLAAADAQPAQGAPAAKPAATESKSAPPQPGAVIDRSPESARIILVASNDFLRDAVLQLQGTRNGTQELGGLQLMANAVEWSLDDSGLLGIRGRGHFNRTLAPLAPESQRWWEYGNYLLALLALAAIYLLQRRRRRARYRRYLDLLSA